MKRALSITLVLTIALSLMIITPLAASASCPFDALTGRYKVVATKNGSTVETFRVGEVFEDVRATVAYYYNGANSAHYGYNHKWWMNGMPIEEGFIFNQVGRYTMTLQCEIQDKEYNWWKKNGVNLPSKTAVASFQFSVLPDIDWRNIAEFKLTSSMSKTTYRQGADEFDPTSILVRAGIGYYNSEGIIEIAKYEDLDWEDLTFYAGGRGMKYKEDGTQITKGYRFWVPGEKDLWVVVENHHIVIPFTVLPFVSSVKLIDAPAMTAGSIISTSDFSVQANYKDGTSEVIGGDSLGISINGQRMYKGGEYDVPSDKPTVILSMGDFSMKGTCDELIGKTVSESEEAKNSRIVTVAIEKFVDIERYKTWDSGQGEIKYTINGGEPKTLFTGGNTPNTKTFSAKVGDKVQVIWSGKDYAREGQVYVYYQDNPAKSISDSSRILGSIPVGKANPYGDNVVASFTVGAIKTTPSSTTKTETVTAKPTNTKFMLNGKEVALPAYEIGGNNYVKLRDIAKLFDFDVDWRDNKVWIEPDKFYTED